MAMQNRIEFRLTHSSMGYDDETFIDGVIVEGYCIDFNEVAKSLCTPGDYEIFTCGCGVAGCAGIFEGVTVRHDGSNILWFLNQPFKAEYKFSKSELISALRKFLLKAVKCKANIGPTLYQMSGAKYTLELLDDLAF
jgi:hypothetical protein